MEESQEDFIDYLFGKKDKKNTWSNLSTNQGRNPFFATKVL